jgi:hypothetical protein
MPNFERLVISGYKGEAVPNTFIRAGARSEKIAVLFPGLNYSCQAPLLYYTTYHLLAKGFDVLLVEYDYRKRGDLNDSEFDELVSADANAAYDAAIDQSSYDSVMLVGKSVGTGALSSIMEKRGPVKGAKFLWITPLFEDRRIYRNALASCASSLFVIGTGDPHYDRKKILELEKRCGGSTLVMRGADHRLEAEEWDTEKNLKILKRFLAAVDGFT